jgi:nucleotide-binding universal stress UspA family protein
MTVEAMPDTPQRIVVGVAGTGASVAAVAWAAREAALRGAVLHTVHAWQPAERGRAPYAPGQHCLDRQADQRAAEEVLASTVHEALGAVGRSADGVVLEAVEGRPVPVLLRGAAGAELLVLGGPPAGGHDPAHPGPDHVGPVARACLRAAPCPVVVVGERQAGALRQAPRRPLAGVAG